MATNQISIFFLRFFFLIYTICEVFIEFVTASFLFYVLVFGYKACEILAPWPGIEFALNHQGSPQTRDSDLLIQGWDLGINISKQHSPQEIPYNHAGLGEIADLSVVRNLCRCAYDF